MAGWDCAMNTTGMRLARGAIVQMHKVHGYHSSIYGFNKNWMKIISISFYRISSYHFFFFLHLGFAAMLLEWDEVIRTIEATAPLA